MARSSKIHDQVLDRYKYPTDELLAPLNISHCEINKICAEIPLRVAFRNYGCNSNKEPDIIYVLDNCYLVGEIKGRSTYNNHRKAENKVLKYSRILSSCGVINVPFTGVGDSEPRLVYDNIRRKR